MPPVSKSDTTVALESRPASGSNRRLKLPQKVIPMSEFSRGLAGLSAA